MNFKAESWGQALTLNESPAGWAFGALHLWCKKISDELWLAFRYSEVEGEKTQAPQHDDLTWSRWVLKSRDSKIRCVPVFPDRPLVVKPEYPFRIIKGSRARIYVQVPVWIRIEQAGRKPVTITDIPTVILSKTWFGTPTEGEHCYWMPSSTRRQIEPQAMKPFATICPVHIINSSNDELLVEKLALRVERLSIFKLADQLWSDETRVTYRGSGAVSKIDMSGKAPVEAKQAVLLSEPRRPAGKGFAARTFMSLKDIPGLSFFSS